MSRFGDFWIDNALPLGLGLLLGVAYVVDGGAEWVLLAATALSWCVWQAWRWMDQQWRK